jgi:transposase
MPNNYPLIYKNLVITKYNLRDNTTIKNLLNSYDISNGSLYNWLYKSKHNELLEKKTPIKQSKYLPHIKCYIRSYVIRNIIFDSNRLIKLLKKKYNLIASKSSIYRILIEMNITRKKIKNKTVNNKKNFTNLINTFKNQVKGVNINDIISIDETSIDTHIKPLYGWSIKNKKIILKTQISRIRYTVITAISTDKVVHYEIIKGSANAEHFKNFIINMINKGITNKYLLLDNARIHHANLVKSYITTTTNKFIFNVPYSPEFNPIEHVFSKIKYIIRSKKNNNNSTKLIKNIKDSFKKVNSNELLNYYKKSLTF